MGRIVSAAGVINDQLDYYQAPDSIVRVINIPINNISLKTFYNNTLLSWTFVDGSMVLDSSIAAGKIYYNEIVDNPGYYTIRTYFDRVGFWRLIFVNSALNSEIIKEYDVLPVGAFSPSSGGLNASFIRSC
jgi:hypothetical protein